MRRPSGRAGPATGRSIDDRRLSEVAQVKIPRRSHVKWLESTRDSNAIHPTPIKKRQAVVDRDTVGFEPH
jgi:hypothetical protein